MSEQYHKIQTVWLRDPANNHKTLLEGQWARPEFEYLAELEWAFTEKVDGTNVRVIWDGAGGVEVRGKTDAAQLPPGIPSAAMGLVEGLSTLPAMTLYCEGFGAKIQRGGDYRHDQGLALFDVWCGGVWLERANVQEIGGSVGLDVVPEIGRGTLTKMIESARAGFASAWGSAMSEGIVARPHVELVSRRGERVITKIKARDFR